MLGIGNTHISVFVLILNFNYCLTIFLCYVYYLVLYLLFKIISIKSKLNYVIDHYYLMFFNQVSSINFILIMKFNTCFLYLYFLRSSNIFGVPLLLLLFLFQIFKINHLLIASYNLRVTKRERKIMYSYCRTIPFLSINDSS